MEMILILCSFLIVLISQILLNHTYSKYKCIEVDSDMTGYEVAKKILHENDLDNIKIGEVSGDLSDHYNNNKQIINLSSDIYHGNTIAAVAVAAHECGHAVQYKEGYVPIKIRNILVPIVNFGSDLGFFIIMFSIFISASKLFTFGVILLSTTVVFQLVTLPVEFDASKRANRILMQMGVVTEEEKKGTKAMLKAAAFTYVASLISSIMEILRLLLSVSRRDD